ncbi:hypothetical protein LOV89_001607 [Campylobacter upsaliensis]|nr:hypothetical protein [Campylobacter upsaliensis]
MSKKERIKLEIDVLKALMLAFLTALFGFCVLNYSRIDWIQALFIVLGVIFACILLYAFSKRIYKILKQIEELE